MDDERRLFLAAAAGIAVHRIQYYAVEPGQRPLRALLEGAGAPRSGLGRLRACPSLRAAGRRNVVGQQLGTFGYASGSDGDVAGRDEHGYARDRIMGFLDLSRPSNPPVITGDLHCSWAADLKANYRDEDSGMVGTGFVGTSITSRPGESYARACRNASRKPLRPLLQRAQRQLRALRRRTRGAARGDGACGEVCEPGLAGARLRLLRRRGR